jgi:hypothetical protein
MAAFLVAGKSFDGYGCQLLADSHAAPIPCVGAELHGGQPAIRHFLEELGGTFSRSSEVSLPSIGRFKVSIW